MKQVICGGGGSALFFIFKEFTVWLNLKKNGIQQ